MVQERNIVTCIILLFVTCGIYGIYWFIKLTDDAGTVNNDSSFSGGKAFLFSLITCGIYTFFWAYKMGRSIYEAKTKRGIAATDNSTMYLLLCIFGLGIVTYCLAQNELNDFAKQGV